MDVPISAQRLQTSVVESAVEGAIFYEKLALILYLPKQFLFLSKDPTHLIFEKKIGN